MRLLTFLRHGRVVWDGTAGELRAQAPASAYALTTSDDERALALAEAHPGVRAGRSPGGELSLAVAEEQLDPYVLELARAGVAVRRLELLVSPLESMFFALAGDAVVGELEPYELAERVLART